MKVIDQLQNPVFSRSDNVRDPTVTKVGDEWHIYYSRVSNSDWNAVENWAVARVRTKDWRSFFDDRDITPKGYGSPGEIVWWQGRWVLPYQSYPLHPSALYFSESSDRVAWSEPRQFLPEALELSWNTYGRAIDPTLVVNGEECYCFFTGSLDTPVGSDAPAAGKSQPAAEKSAPAASTRRANVVGLAVSRDPELQKWEVLSSEAPLIEPSERYPDGAENLTIYSEHDDPEDPRWVMVYSAGLEKQRLAEMRSTNLVEWFAPKPIELEAQWWCERRMGAPCSFMLDGERAILIMGEEEAAGRRTRLGIARMTVNGTWALLPEASREAEHQSEDLSF